MMQQLKEELELITTKLLLANDDETIESHLAELNALIEKVYYEGQKEVLEKVYYQYHPEKTYIKVVEEFSNLNLPLCKNY